MGEIVGYRFHPTDKELISHYLYNKIAGNDSVVQNAIGVINICSFEPWDLPGHSKIPTNDKVWYFFCPRDNKYLNSKRTNRTTAAGYWKATGVDRKIRAKRGNLELMGTKKTLVFYRGRVPKGERTNWVMHEYHPTFISPDRRTYVICKIKNKADEIVGVSSYNKSEPSHSLADSNNLAAPSEMWEVNQPVQETPESFHDYISDYDLAVQLSEQEGLSLWELQDPNELSSNYNVQQPTNGLAKDDQELLNGLKHVPRESVEWLFLNEDESSGKKSLYEHCNDYRPPKSLEGVYVDYSSDSDEEAICARTYPEVSSPADSVGSSTEQKQSVVDGFHGDEILKQDAYNGRSAESSVSSKAGKSQYQSQLINNEAQERPTRLQLQGKALPAALSIDKAREATEFGTAADLSKIKSSSEREWKTAEETKVTKAPNSVSKLLSKNNRKAKGSLIFLETVDINHEPNPPSVYLLKVAIGVFLFAFMVREIVFVH